MAAQSRMGSGRSGRGFSTVGSEKRRSGFSRMGSKGMSPL